MRGVIYTTEAQAREAVELCASIPQGEVEYVGAPSHVAPTPKPYTLYIKHPSQNKWAVFVDAKAEEAIGKQGEELTEDWFPKILHDNP